MSRQTEVTLKTGLDTINQVIGNGRLFKRVCLSTLNGTGETTDNGSIYRGEAALDFLNDHPRECIAAMGFTWYSFFRTATEEAYDYYSNGGEEPVCAVNEITLTINVFN